jgi:signal transduction histidine kinase
MHVLTSFIRDASHEFRTPLSLIMTSLHLAERVDDNERRKGYLERIGEQTQHIVELVDGLLTMSRLDTQETLSIAQIDLNRIVSEVLDNYRTEIMGKAISVITDFSEMPHVQGNFDELVQALDQLLNNAVSYTSEHGQVAVRTYHSDNLNFVEITDSGGGIAENDLPHIFKRFYRGDKAHTSRGIGLGLTIAAKILERHHGYIEVTTVPNEGSTFRVVLPAAYQD